MPEKLFQFFSVEKFIPASGISLPLWYIPPGTPITGRTPFQTLYKTGPVTCPVVPRFPYSLFLGGNVSKKRGIRAGTGSPSPAGIDEVMYSNVTGHDPEKNPARVDGLNRQGGYSGCPSSKRIPGCHEFPCQELRSSPLIVTTFSLSGIVTPAFAIAFSTT